MRENVLNLQVVLADGRVLHTAGLAGRARWVDLIFFSPHFSVTVHVCYNEIMCV